MIEKALRKLIRGLRRDGEVATGGRAEGVTDRDRTANEGSSTDDESSHGASVGRSDVSPDDAETGTGTRTRSDIIAETGMTPGEFVRKLLDTHDGRAYQGTVSEVTGLSKSATSRLLTQMEEDGQVIRVSIGREKVVCLPDHEPEIAENSDAEEVPSGA